MTTDGTVRPPQGGRVSDAPEIKHQAELKPSHAFLFPLGYKDAAYQWVSISSATLFAQLSLWANGCKN
jgi:hypothetical protein